jgi:hypothetical protein
MSPNKTLYTRDEDTPAWERAEQAAKAAGISTSQLVAAALRRYLPEAKDIQVVYKPEHDVNALGLSPQLEYGRHPTHGHCWTLNWADEDANFLIEDEVFAGDLGDAHEAIAWARRMLADPSTGAEEITLQVGDPALTVGFVGRWLLAPDSDDTRTGEDGHDAGAYWGVALTRRGRIAVYTAHCNERWPAQLNDYDTLTDAEKAGVPADIIAMAAQELGEDYVMWRDI